MLRENSELIAVLMPAYNSASFLAQSVQSVLNQSYRNFELIIVDDGSIDGTLEIARTLSARDRRVKVFTQNNAGCSAARNYALKQAEGSLIAFLDSDDTWHPDFLEKLHRALIAQPGVELSYCGWQNLGVSKERGQPYIPPDYEGADKTLHLLQGCPWPIHAVLTNRNLIEKAGGFKENLIAAEDYDLWLRVAIGVKIVRVPEVLAYYHHHGDSNTSANRALLAISQHKVQIAFLNENPIILREKDRVNAKALVDQQLLYSGFDCYWKSELPAARKIFRRAMRLGCGTFKQWIHMLPSILPLPFHSGILSLFNR